MATDTQQISYWCFDLQTHTLLAELPFTGVTWQQRLNAAGQFSGSLNLRDPRVQRLDPQKNGTRPARTLLIADVGGVIEWAGIVWTRNYTHSTGMLTVNATDCWSYFGQRVQAQDYSAAAAVAPGSTYWAANPAASTEIARALILDAIATSGTAFAAMTVAVNADPGSNNYIAEAYPIAQRQTLNSIITQISASGVGTGFDFGIDVAWSNGQGSTPTFTFNISYPRRGRIAGSTGLVIDSQLCRDYAWPEDGTQASNSLYATMTDVAGSSVPISAADATPIAAGYPLLEAVVSYTAINTVAGNTTAIGGAITDDLARLEWPVITPTFTLPLVGDPAVGSYLIGDDTRVIMQPDDRFSSGFDTYLRIVAAQVNVPTEGEPTQVLTCNMPPAAAPTPMPPL